MSDRITDEQVQELTNYIAEKCQEMDLEAEQIVDGMARSLLAAATTFGFNDLSVSIENVGVCSVKLKD